MPVAAAACFSSMAEEPGEEKSQGAAKGRRRQDDDRAQVQAKGDAAEKGCDLAGEAAGDKYSGDGKKYRHAGDAIMSDIGVDPVFAQDAAGAIGFEGHSGPHQHHDHKQSANKSAQCQLQFGCSIRSAVILFIEARVKGAPFQPGDGDHIANADPKPIPNAVFGCAPFPRPVADRNRHHAAAMANHERG